MSRKVFDILTSTGGAVVVVVLLVAGGLLTWGHSFVNSNVHNQLAQPHTSLPLQAALAPATACELAAGAEPVLHPASPANAVSTAADSATRTRNLLIAKKPTRGGQVHPRRHRQVHPGGR